MVPQVADSGLRIEWLLYGAYRPFAPFGVKTNEQGRGLDRGMGSTLCAAT